MSVAVSFTSLNPADALHLIITQHATTFCIYNVRN